MTGRVLTGLIKDLNHPDASRRRLAAERLARADERAIYPLIKALRDESPGVQDASIQSLISIGGEVTAYMITPLLREDSPLLRNAAIVILRSLGKVSVPLLYDLLKDRDDDVRKFSIDLLGDIKDGVDPERVIPFLKDRNPNVRASAAKTLGLLGYEGAVPYLIAALNDEEWVAFSVIEALGQIGTDDALDPLSEVLKSPSEILRIASVEAVGRIGSERAVDILMGRFDKSEGLEKEIILKNLLINETIPPGDEIPELLIELFRKSDWDERIIYLKAISRLGLSGAIPEIIDLAGSIDPSMPDSEEILHEVRARLRDFGCTDPMIDVIKDAGFRFRGKVIAIDVLGDLRCHKAVPYLIELIRTDLRDVRRASIRAIGEIDGEDSREALIDAVSDYDSHVRRAAINALGRIRAKEAFEPLIELLKREPYEDVIEEAVRALLRIDQEGFLSRIGDMEDNVSEIIKRCTGEDI